MASMASELILRLRDGVTGPAKVATAAIERLNKAVASSMSNRSGLGMGAASAALKREAAEIARSVKTVEHSTHAMGTALAGLGIGHGFGEFIKAGADYRKELIALQNSGKTSDEIARSMKAAANIATALPTQTFADSIKIINETTAAYGDLGHALENLQFNSKFESNMKSVLGSHADPHMLQNLVRALEIRGTAFDPHKYQEEAGRLGKAFAFSRGSVNPENFYDFARNSNPDIKQFSTQFLTEVVPTLIQTMGAPGAGTGIKAFEKVWRGGLTDKSQAAEWVRIGMVSAKAVQDNKGQSPGWKSGMAAFSDLAKANPYEAMGKLLEKLKAQGIDVNDQNVLGRELDKLFKNSRARAMAYELGQAVTRAALHKDAGLIRGSADMDQQYENNKDDIYKARDAVKAAFENLMASMSGPLVTSAAHGLWSLAKGVQGLAGVLARHPLLGKTAGIAVSLGAAVAGVAVLRSGLALLGLTGIRPIAAIRGALISVRLAAMASAAWMGRSFLLLLNPLALVRGAVLGIGLVIRGVAMATGIGALVAAGALIYQNWDNIRVAVEAFRGAFMRAIEPVRPILQPILTDLSTLWETITSLIQPTGDMGDNWAKIGIHLGKVLGQDLVPWAGSIRNAYEEVKSLGKYWGEVVTIITSDDPIGRAVTALAPKFNAMVVDAGRAIRDFDWGGAWSALREKADPVLTAFFTGWVDYAKKGADALISYDWAGLGKMIVEAIIKGISDMGSALGDKLKSMIPDWVPGFGGGDHLHGGAGGDDLMGGGGGGGGIGGGRATGGGRSFFSRPPSRASRAASVSVPAAYLNGPSDLTSVGAGATAGMRARNLGNIGWFGQKGPGILGPSNSRDVDHSIALFRSQEDGIRAAAALALRKYSQGRHSSWDLIAAKGGWTPGALGPGASVNVARSMGMTNRDDLHLDNPTFMRKFLRGLAVQEHGKAGNYYTDDMIDKALGGGKGAGGQADARGVARGRGAGPVHIENHFHDVGHKDERQLAGYVADTFHRSAHAGAAGNFSDMG
jgi:hypothetical protein